MYNGRLRDSDIARHMPRIREAVDLIYQFSSFKNKDLKKKQEKRRYVRSIFKIVVLL